MYGYASFEAAPYAYMYINVPPVSSLVYLNGSTDYVEIYAIQASTGNTNNGIERIYVNGSMVRAA